MKRRTLFSLNSVRMRLTLWNVAVLALVLVTLNMIFSFSFQANIRAALDRRLTQRAHRIQWGFFHPPPIAFQAHPPARADDNSFGELRPRFFDTEGRSIDSLGQLAPSQGRPWDLAGLARALRSEEAYATASSGEEAVRVLSVPLVRAGRVVGAVQVANSLTRISEDQARMTRTLLALLPLVLLIAGLGGAFLTDRALRPIRQIAQSAGRIETENLSQRLPVIGNDEFADLADTFNGMLSRLQHGFERREQAFEQQRRFTADASHELRTPLTIIKANTSLALVGHRTDQEYQKALRTVDSAADRMNRIVQDLLLLARSDAGQSAYSLVPTSLADVLAQAVAAIPETERPLVTLDLPQPSPCVQGHEDSLVRLFSNLLENAARHTPSDGRITVCARPQENRVEIEVSDTGEGIAPEHLAHVTERFYRVDSARARRQGGTGLGLAICESIAEIHGGFLSIQSVLGKGTTVRVTLARASSASSLAKPLLTTAGR